MARFFYTPALNRSLRAFNVGLFFGMRTQVAVQALQTLIGYVASGQVRVDVNHTFPLRRAAEAHRLLEQRQSTGKTVLKPWED